MSETYRSPAGNDAVRGILEVTSGEEETGEPESEQNRLRYLVSLACRLLKSDYAAIVTFADDGTSRWHGVDGLRNDDSSRVRFRPGQGIAARVLAAGKPVQVDGIGVEPQYPIDDFPFHASEGGVSSLGVPVFLDNPPHGVLVLGHRSRRTWSEVEVEIATLIAQQCTVALNTMRESAAERTNRIFLERIIENFPGLLMVLGPPDFRILRASSSLAVALPEEFRDPHKYLGKTLAELGKAIGSDNYVRFQPLLQRVMETGEPLILDSYKSESKTLGVTYWNMMCLPIDEVLPGVGRHILLIAYQVTDVVHARQEARRLAQQAQNRADELEAVINQMADGVTLYDADGNARKINPAGQMLLGRGLMPDVKREDYVSAYGFTKLDGEPFAPKELPYRRALAGETVTGVHMMVRRSEDDEVILSISSAPIRNDEGEIVGAVSVFHDVTREKMADRLKDEFLSVVSHELRTPLSAIMGYSDLMLRGVHGSFNERQARALGAVRANANRLLRLINDLLDVSRLEAGSVPMEKEPVDLSEAVERAVTQARVLAAGAAVHISNQVDPELMVPVLADSQKLMQVIENLVTNALKFTPKNGHITLGARLSATDADDPEIMEEAEEGYVAPGQARSVIVMVSDTGAGLREDQLARIWERFYQADSSATRRSGGAGLGLAIVRSLVELQGGQVWARSGGPNKGSRFSFSLPAARSEVVPREKVVSNPAEFSASELEAHGAKTVLVAEDDDDQREIICDMLELEGYRVVVAVDGEEALKLAQAHHPAMIALDVILPRVDGWEVLHRLKSDEATSDIPVLIISVVDQQEFGRKLGADEYLIKPLEPGKLRAAVKRLVPEETATGDEAGVG
jgi:PAS domain S-box-containing protein